MPNTIEKDTKNKTNNSFKSVEPILDFFISMSNKNTEKSAMFGITLTVGGTLISGDIISGSQYFDKLSKQFHDGYKLENNTKADETFKLMFNSFKKTNEIKEELEINHIHLDNIRIYQSSNQPIPNHDGVLWRGKVSDIQGFTFGKLELK